MRFTTIFITGALAAIACAQTVTTPTTLATTTTTDAAAASESAVESEVQKCIDACPAGDVNCTAKCIAVPSPDAAQANATNECVANCPKGNGTAADNLNYSNCVDGCIGQYYFTNSGTPNPTGGAGSGAGASGTGPGATGTGARATGTGASASRAGSGSPTGTGTAAPSGTSKAAADVLRVASPVVGLAALLAAFLV